MSQTKVALITGAARRIGAACVRMLHAHGYRILLHHHTSVQHAQQLQQELNVIRPDSVILLSADLLNLQHINDLAKDAVAVWGGVDVLVNNASAFYPGEIGEVNEAQWDELMGSNLKAPFFLSQALLLPLKQRKGCIVNIVDIHAEKGLAGFPVYSMAKAGLVAMTKCLAKELAPDVRVNAVAPGAILWPDLQVSEQQKIDVLQKVALQRCGDPDDIAKAVRFLCDEAVYVTGQVLAVDGGRSLFS